MPGFEFHYRLSGKRPTVETFVFKNTEALSQGDMLNLEDGEVDLGATGDPALVGAAIETVDGEKSMTSIRAIVDADAVYAIEDPRVRIKGGTLDLSGLTGAQALSASRNTDFIVDVDSSADQETLVRINEGRHYEGVVRAEAPDRLVGGTLNAAIARAVVRYHAEHFGRGPTKAQAFYRDNHVVVVLEDILTQAERSLLAAGNSDAVLYTRHALQDTMRGYLRSTIERLTGCKVRACMSASHVDPDLAAELFVLDRPVAAEPAQPDSQSIA